MNKYERRQQGLRKARRLLRIYRARAVYRLYDGYYDNGGICEQRLLKTRVPCSCPMCGNERRHWEKVTRQELKATWN